LQALKMKCAAWYALDTCRVFTPAGFRTCGDGGACVGGEQKLQVEQVGDWYICSTVHVWFTDDPQV
jgi:hypothetical protein